jgi:hypothetical protein
MGDAAGRIFLSYRRDDTRHVAGRLADRLNTRFGADTVFMDVDALELGVDFPKAIAAEVSSCDVLIALIGQDWMVSDRRTGRPRLHEANDFVAVEIRAALERGIRVIPVLADGAMMPAADELPASLQPLRTRNAARLDHETFSTDVEGILSAVERILHTAATERTSRNRPYWGHGQRPASGPTPDPGRPTQPRVPPAQPSLGVPQGWAPRTAKQPAPEATPAHKPEASATSPIPRVPHARAALRVTLWWVVYLLSMFLASGTLMTLSGRSQGDLAGGIFAIVFLLSVLGGIAILLKKEIEYQRRILRGSEPEGERQVAESKVSTKHVRKVAVICAVVALGFGLLISFTPPTASPAARTSSTP